MTPFLSAGVMARRSPGRRVCGPLLPVLLGVGMSGHGTDAHAVEVQAPKAGTRMVWECSGPFTTRYDLTVTGISDDVVRYEGEVDDGPYLAEKHRALTGTSLWSRLNDDRQQWFDFESFAEYRALGPGETFESSVPARHGPARWVWKYHVRLGQWESIRHPLLGEVRVLPVVERRRVFQGDYWSRMTTLVAPGSGLSVSWEFEDPDGLEKCDLVVLEEQPVAPVVSAGAGNDAPVTVSLLKNNVGRKQ